MLDDTFKNYLINHGREERNLEYKQSMNWSDITTKVKVIKAAMAMSNISDGGYIVFGENKNGELYEAKGMQKEHADSFKQDDVMQKVNEYAEPYVELTVYHVEEKTKHFVIIQINEFSQIPVVCKKDGEGLKRGDIFSRSRRKYESARVGSQNEMREIITLSVDKEIRQLRSRGLITAQKITYPTLDDKQEFEKQGMGL